MSFKEGIIDKKYPQYNDYNFKSILRKRANGLLKFIGIDYKIRRMISSELTSIGPNIHRLDFAGEADLEDDNVCVILECQTNLPTEDDITRFFQYVSSLRVFKKSKVELFILCTEKAPYTKKDFIIKDDCIYTMHMISLKQFKAREIFKNIENKLSNNEIITEEDIASLQVIVYTDYDETQLEVLLKTYNLIERIAEKSEMDLNEKTAIIYLMDVLSANMLTEYEYKYFMEETVMILNPRERYCVDKGRKEGIEKNKLEIAKKLLDEGESIEYISKITELPKKDILTIK